MTIEANQWWMPMQASGGSVLLHVDLAPEPGREERALALLDDGEQARIERFAIHEARRQFVLCRAALRVNLCEWLGCSNADLSFGQLEHGKPFARLNGVRAGVKFNVSHSGRHGLVGLGNRHELGVDLEVRTPGRDFDGIGRTVFGQSELSALSESTGNEKVNLFYRLWSLKEALIKALGSGFSLNPSGFEVPQQMLDGEQAAEFRFPHRPSDPYWLEDLGETRFAAARAWRVAAT